MFAFRSHVEIKAAPRRATISEAVVFRDANCYGWGLVAQQRLKLSSMILLRLLLLLIFQHLVALRARLAAIEASLINLFLRD